MKSNLKVLEFKKVQIAALESATIKGWGKFDNSIFACVYSFACSQSIGTGETTSVLTNHCYTNS